jgi:hypothetical protein
MDLSSKKPDFRKANFQKMIDLREKHELEDSMGSEVSGTSIAGLKSKC